MPQAKKMKEASDIQTNKAILRMATRFQRLIAISCAVAKIQKNLASYTDVAGNQDEDGRARNRRVELIKLEVE